MVITLRIKTLNTGDDMEDFDRIKKIAVKAQDYDYKMDSSNLTDAVTSGLDINILEDLDVFRLLWQECVAHMKNMMAYTEFTVEDWVKHLKLLLVNAGMEDHARVDTIAKEVAESFLGYLKEKGFGIE